MTVKETKELLRRYNAGQCTDLEKTIIEETFMQFNESEPNLSQQAIEEIGKSIFKTLPGREPFSKNVKFWLRLGATAAIIALAIGVWMHYQRQDLSIMVDEQAQDIKPGGNKATLTLANGKIINLSDAKTGVIIGNDLKYTDGSAISNNAADKNNTSGLATISTPKGGEYQIVLPDGTKVWLNAATVLQFSADQMRARGERKVTLVSGEAYFEVAKDKKHPFVVTMGKQDILVLGTHFNINAYEPNLLRTTLLEGSVKVTSKAHSKNTVILQPGEQSLYSDKNITVSNVDSDLETAWKNGNTEFEDADLKTIMAMLERWYNIEVEYEGSPIITKFTGSVSRSRNISEVLKFLESTGSVHFKIEGRKVLVMR